MGCTVQCSTYLPAVDSLHSPVCLSKRLRRKKLEVYLPSRFSSESVSKGSYSSSRATLERAVLRKGYLHTADRLSLRARAAVGDD